MCISSEQYSALIDVIMMTVATGVFFGLLAYDALKAFVSVLCRASRKFADPLTGEELV